MRGVSFWSFIGPAVSARNSCVPPTPSSGRIATASTTMPRPPTSCRKQRHTLTDSGSVVEPVEHRGAGGGEARHRLEVRIGDAQAGQRQQQRQRAEGRQQRPGQADQQEAVARLQLAPKRRAVDQRARASAERPSGRRACRDRERPRARAVAAEPGEGQRQPASAARTARRCDRPGARRRRAAMRGDSQKPNIALTWNSFSTSRTMRLRGTNTITWSPVCDHGVVVRDDDFVPARRHRCAAHDARRSAHPAGSRSPRCAGPTTLRGLAVAARHRLQRLGRAAAQAVHRLDVAAPHVREQLADHRCAGDSAMSICVPCTRSA